MSRKILIIEHEPDLLNLISKFLVLGDFEDFEVIKTTNAQDALKIIKEHYNEISLVLLDIMLPGQSGYFALQEIKNNEKCKDIKVVLLTDKSFNEDIQKLGADASFIIPPSFGGGNDEHFPFPYIFKPPTPPGDLGLAGEPQAKLPITEEEQEYEPYCKHCGAELPKGQAICHVCGKRVG